LFCKYVKNVAKIPWWNVPDKIFSEQTRQRHCVCTLLNNLGLLRCSRR
jgi:hypothetical protein